MRNLTANVQPLRLIFQNYRHNKEPTCEGLKHPPLMDISNNRGDKKQNLFKPDLYLPLQDIEKLPGNQTSNVNYPSQNIHPSLALYQQDLTSGHLSHDDLVNLLH